MYLNSQLVDLQNEWNKIKPSSTSTTSTTSTTTTAPEGLIFVQNNSIDVTVNDLWILEFIPLGTSLYYYAVNYSGANFPIAPGQSGYFIVPGYNPSAIYLQIDYSANSGGATGSGSCVGSGITAPLFNVGGVTTVLTGCGGVPGIDKIITINQ
jgi:hypothetical protein